MSEATTSVEAARAAWIDHERQLYPSALSIGYERILTVVRALADRLRDVTSSEELATRWRSADALLVQTAEACGLSIDALPHHLIAGAAFAMRDREIVGERQRSARMRKIEDARSSGETWVVLDESGSAASGFFMSYRSCEMHLPTGLAIVSTVQPDPASGAPLYLANVVKLERSSGDVVDVAPGIADESQHSQRDAFNAFLATMHDRIDSMTFDPG